MSHKYQVFERDPLYAEVWAEPVQTVAKRYEISDVGLRKICKKLDIPVPAKGYWAKVAAGQKTRPIPLRAAHDGNARYVRTIYIDEDAPEREPRVAQLLSEKPPIALPSLALHASIEECHPAIRRTAKRMRRGIGHDKEWLTAEGSDVFWIHVSDAQRERALLILDAVLTGFLVAGAALTNGAKDDERVHLRVFGEKVGLRIEEKYERYERDLTKKEATDQLKWPGSHYLPDRWRHRATGMLKLSFLSNNDYYPHATLSDGVSTPLEKRLDGLIEKIWAKAAESHVKRQMTEERHARWEAERERQEELELARAAELERLENIEKSAAMWRRAQELRTYARALEDRLANGGQQGRKSKTTASEVSWIRNAADWLDPLVGKPWPAVDDAQVDFETFALDEN